jgi:tetratricopeptide (TPR) repeat protein
LGCWRFPSTSWIWRSLKKEAAIGSHWISAGSIASSYILLRRFPEALRKLDQVLNITPDDLDTVALKAAITQAEGDLPRASALLAPLHPAAPAPALETQVYQAILKRRPTQIIPLAKEILAKLDPALGFYSGHLRFYLGWAQEVAGDHAAAQESWRQARSELESLLKEQPDNYAPIGDLALTNMGLGDGFAHCAPSLPAVPTQACGIVIAMIATSAATERLIFSITNFF